MSLLRQGCDGLLLTGYSAAEAAGPPMGVATRRATLTLRHVLTPWSAVAGGQLKSKKRASLLLRITCYMMFFLTYNRDSLFAFQLPTSNRAFCLRSGCLFSASDAHNASAGNRAISF